MYLYPMSSIWSLNPTLKTPTTESPRDLHINAILRNTLSFKVVEVNLHNKGDHTLGQSPISSAS
ncbi:hypothetical protein BJY01DRAFT_228290 [Aspergillus pseudoustus]|uniref:Uncharacterized protein n=1 Tax=Aspergillus pseudoustus TaxID=1810923 RepID=A0ABR4ILZ9_9EURO